MTLRSEYLRQDGQHLVGEAMRCGLTAGQVTPALHIGAMILAHGFTDYDLSQMILGHYQKAAEREPR